MQPKRSYRSMPQLIIMTVTVNLSTFTLAFSSYMFNGTLDLIKKELHIDNGFQEGLLVSIQSFGCVIGSLLCFFIVKSTPRRHLCFIIDFFFIIGLGMMYIRNYNIFVLSKFLQGMGSGFNLISAPLFIKEIIPSEVYGVLGSIYLILQLFCFLKFLSLSLGTLCQTIMVLGFGDDLSFWNVYIAVTNSANLSSFRITNFFTLIGIKFFPLFIHFLIDTLAKKFIASLYMAPFHEQIFEMYLETSIQRKKKGKSIKQYLQPNFKRRLYLAVNANIIYVMSGILPILSYSTLIFNQFTTNKIAKLLTILMSIIKAAFYTTGGMITQRFGRRSPIIIGIILLTLILVIIGASSFINQHYDDKESCLYKINLVVSICSIYVYFIVFFNGLGAVVPIYTPELVSDQGLTLVISIKELVNILVTFCFPVIKEKFGMSYSFWLFGVLMLLGSFYLFANIRNTQGLNELQIYKLFSDQKHQLDEVIQTDDNLESLN